MGRITSATAEVGERLRALGYPDAPGAGLAARLFSAGESVPTAEARRVLPGGAWGARLLRDDAGQTVATGRVLAQGGALLWLDTPTRAAGDHGVPCPDAIDADLCAALPTTRARRHLDIGGGTGAVALFAARSARQVHALEPRERCALAQRRSVSLSGLTHVRTDALAAIDAATTGTADRLTARLPLEDLALLPHVLDLHGLAIVHVQGGSAGAVVDALHAAFGARPWAGRWRPGPNDAGLLLLRTDDTPGWGPVPEGARLEPDSTLAWLGG